MEFEILDFFINNFDSAKFEKKENRYLFKNGFYLYLDEYIYTEYELKKRDKNLKRCTKCNILKHNSNFYKTKHYNKDTDCYCKDCKHKYLRDYYKTEKGKQVLKNSTLKNPFFKEMQRVRSAALAVKKKVNVKIKTCNILGCDYNFAYKYLNLTKNIDKEIDHILPLSWGETEEEIINLGHYSNLQMLDKFNNISKNNRFCLKKNLQKVLDNHPNKEIIMQIVNRNKDKILTKKPKGCNL